MPNGPEAEPPPSIQAALGEGAGTADTLGMSSARTVRWGERFLKVVPVGDPDPLWAERGRLEWLSGRLPVPEVVAYEDDGRHEWLVTTALAGVPASDVEAWRDAVALVDALADGLSRIHDVPADDCPFDAGTATKLAEARGRLDAGLVDPAEFESAYRRHTPEELYGYLLDARPPEPDDTVFCHGDYCLPNVLLEPATATVTGFVDWGRSGTGDRYLDLAIGARSIIHNTGSPELAARFFTAYGIDLPNGAKVDFFVLLDEFF